MRSLPAFLSSLGVLAMSLAPSAAFAQSTISSTPSSVSSVPSSVSSTPEAPVAITVSLPQSLNAKPGDEIVLPLTVSQGKGINAFAISINFDPAKLTFVETKASQDTQGFKFVDGELDALGGLKERLIGGTSSTAIEKDGPAVLAELTFQVKPTASGELSFQLSNPLDDIINATLQNGTVTIGAAAVSSTPSSVSSTPSTISSVPSSSTVIDTSTVPAQAVAPETLDETGPAGMLALLALAGAIGFALQRRTV